MRLSNMTWSNLRFNIWRSFVAMATNLPSCFFIQFLEQLLKFLVNFVLLKRVKSQITYGFLITKGLIVAFQILDLKDHFSASLITVVFSSDFSYLVGRPSGRMIEENMDLSELENRIVNGKIYKSFCFCILFQTFWAYKSLMILSKIFTK